MKDVKLLGVLNIVWGLMGVTGGLIGAMFVFLPVVLARSGHIRGLGAGEVETITALLALVGGIIAVIALLVSLPSIIGGIGLLKKQEWARILILVLSFIHLLEFPLGTALGIYGIYVLWDQQPAERSESPHSQVSPAAG